MRAPPRRPTGQRPIFGPGRPWRWPVAEAGNRHCWISRQPFGQCLRQVSQANAAGGQRVVAGDGRFGNVGDGDVAGADAAFGVLRGLALEVGVQRLDAAFKCGARMARVQQLDPVRPAHVGECLLLGCGDIAGSTSSRSRAAKARCMAGASGGGFNNSSAKRNWSSMDKRIKCASATVACASLSAAATKKSLTLRPCNSAARRTTLNASGAIRASTRADRLGVAVFMGIECT